MTINDPERRFTGLGMNETAILEKRMADLYIMFCLPRITLNTDTGEVNITYVWSDDGARQTFERLQEELVHHFNEQRKKRLEQR